MAFSFSINKTHNLHKIHNFLVERSMCVQIVNFIFSKERASLSGLRVAKHFFFFFFGNLKVKALTTATAPENCFFFFVCIIPCCEETPVISSLNALFNMCIGAYRINCNFAIFLERAKILNIEWILNEWILKNKYNIR